MRCRNCGCNPPRIALASGRMSAFQSFLSRMKRTVGLVLPLISFLIAACDPPDAPKAISYGDPRIDSFHGSNERG